MRFSIRIPRVVTSTVRGGPGGAFAITDGSDVAMPNRWGFAPHSVALVGRPAVWSLVDIETPRIPLVFASIPAQRYHFEQDFGGHLFIVVATGDAANVHVIEAGPQRDDGRGALLPYRYPEDDFIAAGLIDFDPLLVPPPHGFSPEFFAGLIRAAHRAYDGDQRYTAIEIPFLRVGRDSNSYAVGVLISCGVDPRAIPSPKKTMRWEWTGYPGMEDPVHRANFGAYLGAPGTLGAGVDDVAYHNADGSVRYAVVGGSPYAVVRLPSGTKVELDAWGRMAFAPADAAAHGLPSASTEPPQQIRRRRHFPADPAPAGAEITLVVGGASVPLVPGTTYTGTIVARNDALGLATLQTEAGVAVVLPLAELGVELRDPRRVDRLLRVGSRLTVGLRRDRHPRLRPRGPAPLRDRIGPRRFHAPRPIQLALTGALGCAALVLGVAVREYWRTR
ncbi:MAG: hypothetical protein NVSMB21_22850 [Vulcanimicrobiaceae bacterium]